MTNASMDILLPIVSSPVSVEELTQKVEQNPAGHYAILDACDEPKIPVKVRELSERAVSLYRGSAEENYWAIAPFLVQLDRGLLDWMVEHLWDTPWGVFVGAASTLEDLRKHFRRYLMVRAPDGRRLYFRFYDPRVLPAFLMSCNADEARQFYGPVEWFGAPGKDHIITQSRRAT